MHFPDDENGDVLRRIHEHGFNFTEEHEIAKQIASLYLEDHKSGNKLTNIETYPNEGGGMGLLITKKMFPTYDNITSFEKKLVERVATVDGYLDGWGVLQDE